MSMPRVNLFRKIVLLLLAMLLPIIGVYAYSNKISVNVLDTELNRSNTNQLRFFQNQVDSTIELMGMWPNLLIQDPDISTLRDYFDPMKDLDLQTISLIKRIQSKLSIQQSSSDWKSELTIYSPTLQREITVKDAKAYDEAALKKRLKSGWQVVELDEPGNYRFSLMTAQPYNSFKDKNIEGILLEVSFDSQNISDMLDDFKRDGRRDPLFYNPESGIIFNSTSDKALGSELINQLKHEKSIEDSGYATVELEGEKYMVNMALAETIGWYLIDYMPVSDILGPVHQTNQLFYIIVGSLLLMSCLMAYMLYGQVQVPVKQLMISFKKLQNGDYSVRLHPKGKGKTEFHFLFTRFNSMVEQIQSLFEKVYLEQIHVREAKLKQLQSQINPHFFYNCFSFISSMAKLQNYQSVIAMSQALAKYYRYTTRQEKNFVSIQEELEFVRNYLDIQQMRMNRLSYSIEVAEGMDPLLIPPLIVQPLVENAVLHGIEPYPEAGEIRIVVSQEQGVACIIVEDNGVGLTSEKMFALVHRLSKPKEDEFGYGLWNVQQRLYLRFGEQARIHLEHSSLGGLKIQLSWIPDHNVKKEH
ncbi:sensor histidine kinase [Paenibacillus segetis]|uniref:Sensor histidine kinase YesM n=1 Tax=Paenibacillus segetis TaxID=1325360 RepID=A0ABQ1Y865_9BACL|nr:histidine kinase [Paenibacillus segetis]GGH15501.1 sensor histidine kinase YesM [Paenibacillus segetis]